MKKYQIIEITWLDSLHLSGWQKGKNVQLTTLENMTHKTVGYFWAEDKKSIGVIQSFRKSETEEDTEEDIDAFMEIPKGTILKIKKIK